MVKMTKYRHQLSTLIPKPLFWYDFDMTGSILSALGALLEGTESDMDLECTLLDWSLIGITVDCDALYTLVDNILDQFATTMDEAVDDPAAADWTEICASLNYVKHVTGIEILNCAALTDRQKRRLLPIVHLAAECLHGEQ